MSQVNRAHESKGRFGKDRDQTYHFSVGNNDITTSLVTGTPWKVLRR